MSRKRLLAIWQTTIDQPRLSDSGVVLALREHNIRVTAGEVSRARSSLREYVREAEIPAETILKLATMLFEHG
jgi:hypothetical protein